MKHKDKVKLAKKLLTKEEAKKGVSKFSSAAWITRKIAIANRVRK